MFDPMHNVFLESSHKPREQQRGLQKVHESSQGEGVLKSTED